MKKAYLNVYDCYKCGRHWSQVGTNMEACKCPDCEDLTLCTASVEELPTTEPADAVLELAKVAATSLNPSPKVLEKLQELSTEDSSLSFMQTPKPVGLTFGADRHAEINDELAKDLARNNKLSHTLTNIIVDQKLIVKQINTVAIVIKFLSALKSLTGMEPAQAEESLEGIKSLLETLRDGDQK